MKPLFDLTVLSAAALTLAACGQPAEKTAEVVDDATVAPGTVQVADAWCRPTPNGAKVGGCYLTLTAGSDDRLISVSTALAQSAEVHEMKMDGDVMRMRAIESLDLPKGVAVDLKPGGYHLMLQQLKAPLLKDTQVPITLVFKDAKGAESRLNLQVPVRMSAPGAAGPQGHEGHGGMDHGAAHKH